MSTTLEATTEKAVITNAESTPMTEAPKKKATAFSLNIDDQDIAWLAIDVPGEKMNTLKRLLLKR